MLARLSIIIIIMALPNKPTAANYTTHANFCHYVGIFANQIAINKIRNVPFSRLNEFNYFEDQFAAFLEKTAIEIYSIQDIKVNSVEKLSTKYREACKEIFK